MTKREARVLAAKTAYFAVEKSIGVGGNEADDTDGQAKVDSALQEIAQRMYERWKRLEESR